MANPFGQFKEEKPYISGLILICVGLLGLFGSLNGNLAAMLAALFDPTLLGVANA